MSTAPRFVPLACPTCADDLVGRGADVVAFCPRCERGYRVDRERVEPLRVLGVTARPAAAGTTLTLPFWAAGRVAAPAFHTARPLTLARVATGQLDAWPAAAGFEPPYPLGARLAPETLERIAPLARLPAPDTRRAVLLAVPAVVQERRILLPGCDWALYPDDVLESQALVALVPIAAV
jgi:hypothetical protein